MQECACRVGMRLHRIELIRGIRLLGGAPNKMFSGIVLDKRWHWYSGIQSFYQKQNWNYSSVRFRVHNFGC